MSDINDDNGKPLSLNDQMQLDLNCIEVFFRSMLKPVVNNSDDPNGRNFIVAENFSFDPIRRIYFQDFYRSLLSTNYLYNQLKIENADPTNVPGMETNLVKIKGNFENSTALNTAITTRLGKLGPMEIKKSWFHSNIEYMLPNGNRHAGTYDNAALVDFNKKYNLYQVGLLESIFDEEEKMFKKDIEKENGMVNIQTIAFRMTELFARLSNVRLSALFYTDKMNNYSEYQKCAALDIFYNLLSMISEAKRICLPPIEPKDGDDVDILFYMDTSASTEAVKKEMGKALTQIATQVLAKSGDKVRLGVIRFGGNRGKSAGTATWSGWVSQTTIKPPGSSKTEKTEDFIHRFLTGDKDDYPGNNEGYAPMLKVINAAVKDSKGKIHGFTMNQNNTCKLDNKFAWRPKAKKIIIAMSDEPCDNYTSIERRIWTIPGGDPDTTDPESTPESKWKSLPLKSSGIKYKGNESLFTQCGLSHLKNTKGIRAWQFNNCDEMMCYYKGYRSDGTFGDINWRLFEKTQDETKEKNEKLTNFKASDDPNHTYTSDQVKQVKKGLAIGKEYEFPEDGGGATSAAEFVQQMNASGIEFHYLFWEHDVHGEDTYEKHPKERKWETYCRRKYYTRMQRDIIDKIPLADCSKATAPSALANRVLDICLTGCLNTKDIMDYATSARRNKQRMEMLRPSIFVTNLVYEMMAFDIARQKNANGDTEHYKKIESTITDCSGDKFIWFARRGTIVEKTKGETSGFNANHYDSFTGIHLKLMNDKIMNSEAKGGLKSVTGYLKDGLVALCNAFYECLRDKEVLKVLDLSNPQSPKGENLQNILVSKKKIPDVGELQYALMLERIIAKIYWHLGVTSCEYFVANRPKVNIDIGLRFLTDAYLNNKNELRDTNTNKILYPAYSKVPKYVDHINSLIASTEFKVSISQDTKFVLNNVVTTKETGSARTINGKFKYYLANNPRWSGCPYQYKDSEFSAVTSTYPTYDGYESAVGFRNWDAVGDFDESVKTKYNLNGDGNNTLKCPFAERHPNNVSRSKQVDCCRLRYFLKYANGRYSLDEAAIKARYGSAANTPEGFINLLNKIPKSCPCYSSAKEWLTLAGNPNAMVNPTEVNSLPFIHAIFKNSSSSYSQEEKNALGYDASSQIGVSSQDYTHQPHSPVRLVYLDQIINLCKDLFKINQWIAFHEPYLRCSVENSTTWYYGTKDMGSFEPVSCYRFSNFHAMNIANSRYKSRVKYHVRNYGNPQWITTVNRDLSGETAFEKAGGGVKGGKWNQTNVLDNQRKVQGTSSLEAHKCFKYALESSNAIKTGLVQKATDKNNSYNNLPGPIIRKKGEGWRFYELHLMTENANSVNNAPCSALATYEVYVKRFRPIFLPDANDLYECVDKDPVYPKDSSKCPEVSGWEITPHKYTNDIHFGKGAIIVPMNISSRNDPRGNSFQELDSDFAHAKKDDKGNYVSGFCKYVIRGKDPESWAEFAETDATKLNILKNLPEYAYFHYYFFRDWLWPASTMNYARIPGGRSALISLTYGSASRAQADNHGRDGANTITRGDGGHIELAQGPTITHQNLKNFDNRRNEDWSTGSKSDKGDNTGVSANWLYITTPPPDYGGGEVTQSAVPLPWVFWHSGRGGYGVGPSYYYHGLGFPNRGHENGFCDSDSRWFAVDRVLGQDPVMMCLAGHFGSASERVATGATADKFAKGFFDPSCCGTSETWHTHGSKAYGWSNVNSKSKDQSGANKSGPRPDKYNNPYNSAGNHVLVGDSLTSVSKPNGLFDGNNIDGRNPSKTDYNATIRAVIKGRPMTWNLWNVIRMTIWNDYNREDWDYNKTNDNRATIKLGDAATLEEKTFNTMRDQYRQWWKRFVYKDKYTSQAGLGNGKSTAWPYKEDKDDPANYWEAQRLQGGNTTTIGGGGTCNIEWSGLVADISILYNEVSDTHDSCLTFYTGSYPDLYNGKSGRDSPTYSASGEFLGNEHPGSKGSGVQNTATSSNPFRYSCDGVDMCRNFMSFVYGGYNSTVPRGHGYFDKSTKTGNGDATGKFEKHDSLPANLSVAKKITTIQLNGTVYTKKNKNNYGTEFTMHGKVTDVYPKTENNDTEPFDSNFTQRVLLPVYPNWESLHNSAGNPLNPDEVSEDQFKRIIFCIAPMTYWEPYYGNEGKPKKGHYQQVGERQMGFCITNFYMGDKAEALVGKKFDNEFINYVTDANTNIISDTPGHDFDPTQPPWGEALQHPANIIGDWKWSW